MVESYSVIGGEGFLGHNLVKELAKRFPDAIVSSLDIVQRHTPPNKADSSSTPAWAFYTADLTDEAMLTAVLKQAGTTVLFHTASPFGTAEREVCEKINVVGTQVVVRAVQNAGVKKFVYTSSGGVVFEGVDLLNVDERLPPSDHETIMGAYNISKAKAERIVLDANGQDGLLTCAIRPVGIFGPGDRQAIPGFIRALKNGQTKFQLGDNNNLVDWTYVDNVVHGHILAAEKLHTSVPRSAFKNHLGPIKTTVGPRPLPTSYFRPEGTKWLDGELEMVKQEEQERGEREEDVPIPAHTHRFHQFHGLNSTPTSRLEELTVSRALDLSQESFPVAGQVFFITNGEPSTFWTAPRYVWKLGADHVPSRIISMPRSVGLVFASLVERFCSLLGKESAFTPTTCRYACASRYYDIEKARRMLGYEPIVGIEEGFQRSVEWAKSAGLF